MMNKDTNELTLSTENKKLEAQKGSPISPPTPLASSVNHISSMKPTSPIYSLFDSGDSLASPNSPWDWLPNSSPNTLIQRKHSIDADGNDFSNIMLPIPSVYGTPEYKQNNSYWRRASEPNDTKHVNQVCACCSHKKAKLFPSSCNQHQFCHTCSTSHPLLMQGVCARCPQTMKNHYDMHLATKPNNTVMTDYFLQPSYPGTPTVTAQAFSTATSHYPCIKLSNIPWDVSQNDIRHFFGNCRSPSMSAYSQSIHIMMDRTTGKTLSDAYVEFATVNDMRIAIETKNQKPLKGRTVSVTECSQQQLLSVIFPKWRGQFHGTLAIPPASDVVKTMSTAAGGGNSGCPPFITREEINSLLVVCKNYKLHFSRKCAERPFENIISVIAKYPWHQSHLISTMHRDHVYEMLKLSIESLKTHLSKDYVQIDSTLLERLVRAGIMCSAFTERQKTTLLQTARIECPADIESLLVPSVVATTSPNVELNAQTKSYSPLNFQTEIQDYFPSKQDRLDYSSDDSGSNDDDLSDFMLSSCDSSISSLMRDIQQNCYINDKSLTQKTRNSPFPAINSSSPLQFSPIQQLPQPNQYNFTKPIRQLSPWAPSYAPNSPSTDIWRAPTSVESS